jgi:multidrug efflux pump subunit AcrA (membrane-fusion protein)
VKICGNLSPLSPALPALPLKLFLRPFSPVDGRVVAVSADLGQRVKAGDPLLYIAALEKQQG